ncbi:hypothetical protein L873DRAFT_1803080 [Choiromyces venosus 120613-1]|uniref:Uncharacterized protein n=1 Tax=Choiromyces venosus 120613-1 TaxID=1336337 RepID=A0A3N4K7B7_9PEZI|nr:hypothetical protein L873DRAFT_1803080 [Choiromyces venosus 120613-1]
MLSSASVSTYDTALPVAPPHSSYIYTNGLFVINFSVEIISATHIVGMFIFPRFI